MTYDTTEKALFSADAFGTFGALNGKIFADQVNFERDYLDEARRYYTNIVGKYGSQVNAILKKASTIQIDMVCPLHGFVWRRNLEDFFDKYVKSRLIVVSCIPVISNNSLDKHVSFPSCCIFLSAFK